MIIKNKKINFPHRIEEVLSGIRTNIPNRVEGVYLDEVFEIFLHLEDEIIIPGISVKELDYKKGFLIFEEVVRLAPQYFFSHRFMEKRKPSAEEHSLQFCRGIEGVIADFVHVIRIDFRFAPGSGSIIRHGNSDTYPSYKADRLYFKSRLVPVKKGSDPEKLESIKIKDSEAIEGDNRRFTSVVFDESSSGSMSQELSKKAGSGLSPFPVNIYPFVVYDYFTACLTLPDPLPGVLEKGVEIFEPLFFYIYSQYRKIPENIVSAAEAFPEALSVENNALVLTGDYTGKLKSFFSRYSIYTDDALMLKGHKKIIASSDF